MKEVKDKILKKTVFKPIQEFLMSNNFPWYYAKTQVINNEDASYMFHSFFHHNVVNSSFFNVITPLLDYLKPIAIVNIRANLQLNRTKVDSHYHVDRWSAKVLNHKTAIFYVNTNNGYTEFQADGEKVNCVENRIVKFPSTMYHKAVHQTDTDQRIVINFNYYDG